MGNCSHKGMISARSSNSFRVMTDSGKVISFECPKLVGDVVDDYPGYGIFGRGHVSSPLSHDEQLLDGQLYYLLPLESSDQLKAIRRCRPSEAAEPVRMSSSGVALDLVTKNVTNGSGFQVLPPPRKGVWRVKLVINTQQLEDILSEDMNTEALIEQMRVAASLAAKVTTPRRRIKGSWGSNLKPILCNVFRFSVDCQQDDDVLSTDCVVESV